PAPIRPRTPGSRGRAPTASAAIVQRQVPGTDEVAVLARGEAVEQVPVARAAVDRRRPRVPAHERPGRRAEGQDAAVIRHEAGEERRRLPEPPPALVLVAVEREERVEALPAPAVAAVERLVAPEEEDGVAPRVVEVVRVLALHAVGGPG